MLNNIKCKSSKNKKSIVSEINPTEVIERLNLLEIMLKASSDFLMNLAERIGHNFAKQVFSIEELSIRWSCSESQVRNIMHAYNLKLLRGQNNQICKPYKVLRKYVLEFENGSLGLYKEKYKRPTKPIIPTWEEKPHLPITENGTIIRRGVRRLGDL